jgi:hypothetical protein
MLRDAIFGLEQRPGERGLRQQIMDLVGRFSPAPEISFSGPVDTALTAAAQEELISRLTAALGPDERTAGASQVSIAVDGTDCQVVIGTSTGPDPIAWSIPVEPDP